MERFFVLADDLDAHLQYPFYPRFVSRRIGQIPVDAESDEGKDEEERACGSRDEIGAVVGEEGWEVGIAGNDPEDKAYKGDEVEGNSGPDGGVCSYRQEYLVTPLRVNRVVSLDNHLLIAVGDTAVTRQTAITGGVFRSLDEGAISTQLDDSAVLSNH